MDRRVTLLTVLLVALVAVPTATPAPLLAAGTSVAAGSTPDAGPGATATLQSADGLGGSASAGSTGARPAAAATTADSTIVRTTTLHLTPNRPGEVEAVLSFDVPSAVTELRVRLQSNADVQSTEHFRADGGEYVWTGAGDGGSVTFTYDANESTTGGRASNVTDGAGLTEYSFADTGDWALVRVPGAWSSWRWVGSGEVTMEKEFEVAGEGTTGGYMAYLGPMTRYTRTASGQQLTLAVPAAAELRESPRAILDSLANASAQLRVGPRDDSVLLIAAPESVPWSSAGLQYGDTDAWVVADARLDRANNVWIHEYVHTRQEFRTNRSGRWLTEASADYYAALLTYDQGRIGYDAFREKLARGQADPQSTAVLAEPTTWSNNANYLKGALVVGAIDRRLRAETDGGATFQGVLRDLNAQGADVENADLLAAVESAASADARSYAARYTTGSGVPDTWSRETHADLFGPVPASFSYVLADDSPAVAGPFRNTTVTTSPTLAAGETLTVRATVENVGGGVGSYRTAFTVDGATERTASGELDPGETATLSFEHTFDEPGTYELSVADRDLTVTVREPATPRVTGIEAPDSVRVGETFTVRATVDNEADWPAAGAVTLSLDGEESLTDDVRLPPRSRLTYTGSVTLSEAGEHVVRVGGQQVTVTAVEPGTTASGTGTGDDATGGSDDLPTPGFGASAALAALCVLFVAGLSRRR